MVSKRWIVVLGLLTACGTPVAAGGGDDYGGHECPSGYEARSDGHPTTTECVETTTTPHPSTTRPEHTTTTYRPHETTTTVKTTTTVGGTTTVRQTTTTTGGGTTTTTIRTTTTTIGGGTTTSSATTTTSGGGGTTTSLPTPGLFSVNVFAFCGPDNLPEISITFGNRPDLNGQTGVLSFSTGGSVFLVFQSNQTVTIPYPNTTQNVNLIYSLGPETATGSVTYPEDCPPGTTTTTGATSSTSTTTTTSSGPTTSTTAPPSNSTTTSIPTTSSSSTVVGPTSSSATTLPPTTLPATTLPPTTLPPTFQFSGAATICVREVPTIRITFGNTFPALAGQTGTLTMSDINGNVVSTQPLVYQPGTTVDILYPGTSVNPDGSIDDVPGWILTDDGFWIRDDSDAFLREGILLTYTVNPTATAFVTYPPESSTCANPSGPFPPGGTPPSPVVPDLPPTGSNDGGVAIIALLLLTAGAVIVKVSHRRVM